jgi:hypothetical protein
MIRIRYDRVVLLVFVLIIVLWMTGSLQTWDLAELRMKILRGVEPIVSSIAVVYIIAKSWGRMIGR